MKSRKRMVLTVCIILFCVLLGHIIHKNGEENYFDNLDKTSADCIDSFSLSENLTRKLGDAYGKLLKEKLEETLVFEITKQEADKFYVQVLSDYVDVLFCFGAEQQVKATECSIFLEVPGFEHRFYGEDNLVNLYLQLENVNYLLGTAMIEDVVYFLPLGENEVGVFYNDEDIRRMLEQYQTESERWEYVWVDEWKGECRLLVRTAQERETELPGTLWEEVQESEKEIFLGRDTKIICVDLRNSKAGYHEVSPKNFHSILKESGSNVYFIAWENGNVVCMINIFIS